MIKKTSTLFAFALVFSIPTAVFALGISPAHLEIQDILPTNEITQNITISRTNIKDTEKVSMKVTGDAAAFIRAEEGDTITLPAGKNVVQIPIIIAPKGAKPGVYTGAITLAGIMSDVDKAKGINGVMPGVQSKVKLTVTDTERVNFSVPHMVISLESGKNLVATYTLSNKGNVSAKVGDIAVSVTDHFTHAKVKDAVLTNGIDDEVAPFSELRKVIPTGITLDVGYYDVVITLRDTAGTTLLTTEPNFLQVGTPPRPSTIVIQSKGISYTTKMALGGLFSLLLIFSIYKIYRLRKK